MTVPHLTEDYGRTSQIAMDGEREWTFGDVPGAAQGGDALSWPFLRGSAAAGELCGSENPAASSAGGYDVIVLSGSEVHCR